MAKLKDVLINRADAHRLELAEMNADGYHVRDGVRFIITNQVMEGQAFEMSSTRNGGIKVKPYKLEFKKV